MLNFKRLILIGITGMTLLSLSACGKSEKHQLSINDDVQTMMLSHDRGYAKSMSYDNGKIKIKLNQYGKSYNKSYSTYSRYDYQINRLNQANGSTGLSKTSIPTSDEVNIDNWNTFTNKLNSQLRKLEKKIGNNNISIVFTNASKTTNFSEKPDNFIWSYLKQYINKTFLKKQSLFYHRAMFNRKDNLIEVKPLPSVAKQIKRKGMDKEAAFQEIKSSLDQINKNTDDYSTTIKLINKFPNKNKNKQSNNQKKQSKHAKDIKENNKKQRK